MKIFLRNLLIMVGILAFAGCASEPLGKYDADRSSESTWEVSKKSLMGGSTQKYDIDLTTKGIKFVAKIQTQYRNAMTGATTQARWTVRCNGEYVWITDSESSFKGGPWKKGGALRWKVDPEFLRPNLFWKTNSMAGNPEEKGTEEIDGKNYKVFESVMGNAMGGSTKYRYLVDESNSTYRRLSREFIGDNHTDVFDCVKFKASTSATDADFQYSGEAEDITKFDIFNDGI